MSTTGKSLFLREYEEYMNWGGLPERVFLSVKRNDEEKNIEDTNGVIEVIPCWKWLLHMDTEQC